MTRRRSSIKCFSKGSGRPSSSYARPDGRIVRTNFLLLYCADPALRARIAGQLNKGETLHALRRPLVIGPRAQIPADEDDHRRHALSLQILVNAVQVWNARYMTASIDHLHTTRPDVVADEDALARVTGATPNTALACQIFKVCLGPPIAGVRQPAQFRPHPAQKTSVPGGSAAFRADYLRGRRCGLSWMGAHVSPLP